MEIEILEYKEKGENMAEFRGQRITNAGRNLLGRALAKEGKFIFTRAKMGDKKIIGNPDEATDLASPKLDMKIIDVSNDQGTVKDRKSTRLNSSHANISYAVFCLKKKKYKAK